MVTAIKIYIFSRAVTFIRVHGIVSCTCTGTINIYKRGVLFTQKMTCYDLTNLNISKSMTKQTLKVF